MTATGASTRPGGDEIFRVPLPDVTRVVITPANTPPLTIDSPTGGLALSYRDSARTNHITTADSTRGSADHPGTAA